MQLLDIGPDTERAFSTCLAPEGLEEPRSTAERRSWYARTKDEGYKAQVLVLDDGRIVGKCHYVPIEHSPFVGRDLIAILCVYVHMYGHHIGDQRGKGYGRFMLDHVERAARVLGAKGVVAWAMDWDWNPVSFYQHMGYRSADREDKVVVVWKPFCEDAEPPQLLRLPSMPTGDSARVRVIVADNAWCNNNDKRTTAREAIAGIEHMVEYTEVGPPCCNRIIHLGHVGGVFLDGRAYRPYQLIGASGDLRAEIIRLYERKQRQP